MGKCIRHFAGGRLTFLKLGSASVGFSGCVGIGSQIFAIQFNACHDKSICGLLTCFVCLLMMGSE